MGISTILATAGSLIAGAAIATVTVVGLVNAQTGASGPSPTSVKDPVTVQYGTNS